MKHPCKLCGTQNIYCSGCEEYLNYLKHKSKKLKKEQKRIIKFLNENKVLSNAK